MNWWYLIPAGLICVAAWRIWTRPELINRNPSGRQHRGDESK